MRFDFTQDKRLMGPEDQSGGAGSLQDTTLKGYMEALLTAKGDTAKTNEIFKQMDAYLAKQNVARATAETAGKSGVESANTVRNKTAGDLQANADRAASKTQDLVGQAWAEQLNLFKQSGQMLLNAQYSIEQTKAGFSGMLEVLGIVAKKLGFNEFSEGCLDLAKELRPQAVAMDPGIQASIEDYKSKATISADRTRGIIANEQAPAQGAIAMGQRAVEAMRDAGTNGTQSAPYAGPLDGASSSNNQSTPSITKAGYASVVAQYLGNSGEKIQLTKAFDGIAKDGVINTAAEASSLKAIIRSNVADQAKETQILSGLGLAPNPNKSMGG